MFYKVALSSILEKRKFSVVVGVDIRYWSPDAVCGIIVKTKAF